MRFVESAVGVVIALAVMVLSAVINARYGMALAKPGFDALVMAAVAIFADVGKAVCWIFFAQALARRHVMAAVASLFIFLACLSYAVAGSLGYVAMQRAQATASVESKSDTVASLRKELQREEQARAGLGAVEPASAIAKRIEAKKQDARYKTSLQCTDATAGPSRTFCAEVALLEAEQIKARTAAEGDAKITTLRQRLEGLGGVAGADKGDFQGALIAQLTNLNLSTIQMSLALLVVVMVESGACFLLWLSLNHGEQAWKDWRTRRRQPAATVVGAAMALVTTSKTPVVAGVTSLDSSISVAPVATPAALLPPTTRPSSQTSAAPPITTAAEVAAPTQVGDLVVFIEQGLDLQTGEKAEVGEIARAYKQWCMRKSLRPLTDDVIMEGLVRFCEVGGIVCEPHGDKVYLQGVVIAKGAQEKRRRAR